MLTKTTFCAINVPLAPRVIILFSMTLTSHEVITLQDLTKVGVGEGELGVATKEEGEEAVLVSEAEAEEEDVLEPSMPHHQALQKMAEQWMMEKKTKLTQVTVLMKIMMTILLTHMMIKMSFLLSPCPRRLSWCMVLTKLITYPGFLLILRGCS